MPRDRTLPVLFALTLTGFLLMLGCENLGAEGTSSQLQLQFAWTADATRTVLKDWGDAGRARVVNGIYADYLFLVAYTLLLLRLLRTWRQPAWLAWGVGLAGGLDALENGLLLGIIRGGLDPAYTLPVSLMATVKFGLIGIALLHLGARRR